MLHKEFWGLLFIGFVVWIFISANPSERIERFCKPIGWGGNLVTSLAALSMPDYQVSSQKWFNRFEYGCQYMTWRVIYQEDYNKMKAAEAAALAAKGASSPGAAKPASAASAASAASSSDIKVPPPKAPESFTQSK